MSQYCHSYKFNDAGKSHRIPCPINAIATLDDEYMAPQRMQSGTNDLSHHWYP
jgi:hypothetical protein